MWDAVNETRKLAGFSSLGQAAAGDVNAHGVVVGSANDGVHSHALVWVGGTVFDLGSFVTDPTLSLYGAHAVDEQGWILAGGLDASSGRPVAVTVLLTPRQRPWSLSSPPSVPGLRVRPVQTVPHRRILAELDPIVILRDAAGPLAAPRRPSRARPRNARGPPGEDARA